MIVMARVECTGSQSQSKVYELQCVRSHRLSIDDQTDRQTENFPLSPYTSVKTPNWSSHRTIDSDGDRYSKTCIERYWKIVSGFRLMQFPPPKLSPSVLPRGAHNFLIKITANRCQMEQKCALMGVVKSWVSFAFGYLLHSTLQLNPNSLPRCAHSSCKWTKIVSG